MSDRTGRIIGLTGGICTGKTTISNYLEKFYKLLVFDADIYAREAVSLGSAILQKIADRYGEEILNRDRTLNRKKLGEIVFNNQGDRLWLEQQIHPYVRQCFVNSIKRSSSQYTRVLVVPLLFEANMTDLVTEIWVAYCSPEKQIERLMARESLTEAQAIARINSQMPLEEKRQKADVVLDNSSTLENLLSQVDAALNLHSAPSSG